VRKLPLAARRADQMAEHPGCALHSAELKLAHCAAVPAQAVQVQPPSVHWTLVTFVEQASGVPLHDPFQWQPETLLHVAALTRVVHTGGSPVQAAFQVQPESAQGVARTRLGQAVAAPVHLLPTQPQPLTLPHAANVVAAEHLVGVPEQLSVGVQPVAAEHS
jgi:hypothetical protein